MTEIVAAVTSSHAFALSTPDEWDRGREFNRGSYKRRWGELPPEYPAALTETLESNHARYQHLKDGFAHVRHSIDALAPDVCLLFGDDQKEHFTDVIPQFAIYTGEHLTAKSKETGLTTEVSSPSALARHLLEVSIEAGFDVTEIKKLPDDVLLSHSLVQIIQFYELTMPVLPIWINCIAPPCPSPARCREFGHVIRAGLDAAQEHQRAIVYGSGGLSHFTGGYPFGAMEIRAAYGSIDEAFDEIVVRAVREGRGGDLAAFTSDEFLAHGEIETRQWVALLGLLHDAKPDFVEYDAFYRGVMGMGLAYWSAIS